MARTTDPVCKLCRREGVKLFLKGSRCETPKCAIDRRNSAPGMHGYRRAKLSEYGVRLREKQKLKRFYGILERQFRRYFALASRSPENTGEVLLQILERRLDNIVHRLGFAPNRAAARQMVTHGHIQVNGKACNIPSLLLRGGDTVRIKGRPAALNLARNYMQENPHAPAEFLERGGTADQPEGRLMRLPTRGDVDPRLDVREQLIIEFCSR